MAEAMECVAEAESLRSATARAQVPFLTVIILTYNEEQNLPFCLASLAGLSADIRVVDSGSTDRTCSIAREFGAHVASHDFQTQAKQFNWALDNVAIGTPWIMRLDADERLTPELRDEILNVLSNTERLVAAYMVKRRVYFWGRWIRFGGYYPVWLLRIWRSGHGRCEDIAMDEHVSVRGGRIERLSADIIDENRKGLAFWIAKHNAYSDREAQSLLESRSMPAAQNIGSHAARQRWLKNRIYRRSPLFLRAFLYWFLRYFIMFGFLDGAPGFVFHFLQAFWYRLAVDAKIHEEQRAMAARQRAAP